MIPIQKLSLEFSEYFFPFYKYLVVIYKCVNLNTAGSSIVKRSLCRILVNYLCKCKYICYLNKERPT